MSSIDFVSSTEVKSISCNTYLEVAVTKAPAFRLKSSLAAVVDMLLIGVVAMLDAYYVLVVFALDVAVLDSGRGGGRRERLFTLH